MRLIYMALLVCIVLSVIASGCSGRVENGGGLNNTGDQSWPKLFDKGRVSWYEYNLTNMTSGRMERQLTVSYSDSEYMYTFANGTKGGGPTVKTSVRMTWLDMDRIYGADIQDNKSDGRPVNLIIYMGETRAPHSIAPLGPYDSGASAANNTWLITARSYDLADRFDVEKHQDIHVSGFDFLSYNNSTIYCSVFASYGDPVFRAWRNASMPVPVKIIAYSNATRTDIPEVWAFELAGWG